MADIRELSDEELLAMIRGQAAKPAPAAPMSNDDLLAVAGDVAKSGGIGVVKGGVGLLGAVGDLSDALAHGSQAAGNYIGGKMGFAPSHMPEKSALDALSSKAIRGGIEQVTGQFYEPKTTAGRYTQSVGEQAVGLIGPGGIVRKGVSVVGAGLGAEGAGQAAQRYAPGMEGIARVAGALTGGLSGSGVVSAVNNRAVAAPGMAPGSSRVLERAMTPGAEQRLAELGPDAFLLEGSPAALGVAQGVATRPGPGMNQIVEAANTRQRGANARLATGLDETLGPAVAPSRVEASLQQQRDSLSPLYEAVVQTNNPVELGHLVQQLQQVLPEQAGATRKAMQEALDMLAPFPNTRYTPASGAPVERVIRSTPREVLNVRQALDDSIAQTPEAGAKRVLELVRRQVDNALGEAVPDIKVLDKTFAGLMKESEAVETGRNILQTGREAIRPIDLIAQREAMRLPEREAQRIGARAEIDRIVGTNANDTTKLKQLIQADGDWNRAKLAELFGEKEANRLFKIVDREVQFQEVQRKLVEGSMTAQRLGGADLVKAETAVGPSLKDTTMLGAVLGAGQKGVNKIAEALAAGRRGGSDIELGQALTRTGTSRDELLRAIRNAQTRRARGSTTTTDTLVRALIQANAARQGGGR